MSQCTWTTPPSKEPIEIPTRKGMKVSTSGVLTRAADCLEGTKEGREFVWGLRELNDCLRQLRENPTPENVGEFLSLWV